MRKGFMNKIFSELLVSGKEKVFLKFTANYGYGKLDDEYGEGYAFLIYVNVHGKRKGKILPTNGNVFGTKCYQEKFEEAFYEFKKRFAWCLQFDEWGE